MRKKHLVLWVIGMLILGCLGGCGNPNEDAMMQDTDDKERTQEALGEQLTEAEENAEKEINEASGEQTDAPEYVSSMEEVEALGLPDDMLNMLEEYPSFDSYWNDSLVLLDRFNEDVRLYGINATKQTAMLLSIEGERVLIEEGPYPSFQNLYQELPNLNVLDVDGDGEDEVMISLRTVTGSPISRYAMLVCDHKDTWNIYMYYDYLRDVQNLIQYRYDAETNSIAFLDNEDTILWEGKLPEWTMEYPYAGTVNFGDKVRFDAETFQMDIVPGIELENSLPYEPVKITFHLGFTDGRFEIVSYDVNSYRAIEERVNQ